MCAPGVEQRQRRMEAAVRVTVSPFDRGGEAEIGDGDRLAFRHDLIREAIDESMAAAVRQDLHRAAADVLSASGAPLA